jgi:hypothetical protein
MASLTQQDVQKTQQFVDSVTNAIRKSVELTQAAYEQAVTKNKQWEEVNKKLDKKTQYNSEINRLSTLNKTIIDLNYKIDKDKLDLKYKYQYITESEYTSANDLLTKNYNKKVEDNDKKIKDLQELLANLDPTVKQKIKKQKQKNKKIQLKIKITKKQKQATIKRLKSLGKSGALLILPYAINIATTQLTKIITNIDEVNSKIDALNEKIDIVNSTPNQEGINIVIAEKNSILNQINDTENRIRSVKEVINQINLYLQIFNITLLVANTLLTLLPAPPAPAIGFPAVVEKIRKIIDKATKILAAISVILPIITQLLDESINDLEEAKTRIKDIENQLEGNASSGELSLTQSDILVNQTLPLRLGDAGNYKGFKFVIKTENTAGAPKINGIGRHYGVAIDTNGVEVLKTDLSFTQDVEVLTDQLKFIIDSQNLIA